LLYPEALGFFINLFKINRLKRKATNKFQNKFFCNRKFSSYLGIQIIEEEIPEK